MQTLVTGGAGFIGSTLVRALLARGDSVAVLDDFSTGKAANLAGLEPAPLLRVGDVRDPAITAELLRGVECVYHLAARVSVPGSFADPIGDEQVNCAATLQLLQLARRAGVRRVVFSGTCAIYGDSEPPLRETTAPRPQSPYAISKLAAEQYVRLAHHAGELETVALRYFNVYGPRQSPDSAYSGVLARFLAAALRGQPPVVHGDGEQTRDFVFVDDVVAANLLACERGGGGVFNIGSGRATSLREVLGVLGGLQEPGEPPLAAVRHEAAREGDIRHSRADLEHARAGLGYAPKVALPEGLRRTLAWQRAEARAGAQENGPAPEAQARELPLGGRS